MRLKWMTSALLIGATTGLVALAGCDTERGQEGLYEEEGIEMNRSGTSFNEFDANGDGFLSEQEFNSIYDRWDTDQDGMIGRQEYRF